MGASWVENYFTAWSRHAQASAPKTGAAELARMLAFMSADIRYEDVPTGLVFIGHAGVREMGAQALLMANDLRFTLVSAQMSDDQFAFETETDGTNTGPVGAIPATGRTFKLRGVSIGRRSPEGTVVSHKDYWDLAGYLRQIGLLPDPGRAP